MEMYMFYTPDEAELPRRRNFLTGMISYIARESTLLSAKMPSSCHCDIMVVSAHKAHPTVAAAIYDEARRRFCRRVFLDTEHFSDSNFYELCTSLLRRGLKVFSPWGALSPDGVVPVVDTALTGSHLSELLGRVKRDFSEFAVSISPMFCVTSLPAGSSTFRILSRRDIHSTISREDIIAHFSPQMHCKYFLQNPCGDNVSLFLFDDNETLTSKVRQAKKHGAGHAFFVHSEITDIQFNP